MNKFTFFSIVATMWIMALFPVKVHAAINYVDYNGITYRAVKTNAGALVGAVYCATSRNDIAGDITIERNIIYNGDGYQVTSILTDAFYNCRKITTVDIPESVETIAISAFNNCTALTSIEIPSKVQKLYSRAFKDCTSLGRITLPGSLTQLDFQCFENIKPNAVITCHAVTPPHCDTYAGGSQYQPPFEDENIDKKILFVPEQSVAAYRATEPWSKMKVYAIGTILDEITVDNIVYTLDNETMTASVKTGQSKELSGAITIASSVEVSDATYRVTSIQENAFYDCQHIQSVVIPNGITSIGESAFMSCQGLTSVEIPEGVTQLEDKTFASCLALADITLPRGLLSIGSLCFYGIKKDATITCYSDYPPVVADETTFDSGQLKDKTLFVFHYSVDAYKATAPWSEMNINYKVGSIVDEITMASVVYRLDHDTKTASVKSNQSRDLSGSIVIASSVIANGNTYRVTSIEEKAFLFCAEMTSIVIPKGITTIEKTAFGGSGLTSVEIPEGVTELQESTFEQCMSLADISLPSSLKTIGKICFKSTKAEATIICHGHTPPTCVTSSGDKSFDDGALAKKTVYVPARSLDAYKSKYPWSWMIIYPMDDTILGDVDGNDSVDMADVNAAINAMLGKAVAEDYNADVDENGSVDMADINIIINAMLGK